MNFLKFLFLILWMISNSVFASLSLEKIADQMESVVDIQNANDGSMRLFFVHQNGKISIFKRYRVLEETFLNLSSLITSGGEQGLLGLAFHPDYLNNRKFYVNYTDVNGDTKVVQYKAKKKNKNKARKKSAKVILSINQPFSNHNGGQLAFGPDGYLYISTGDGGSGGDPQNNAQNLASLLGKILRIDVDHGYPYTIPVDNPFVGHSNAFDEIWAYGLRNPWRMSFDTQTGDLFIADVGQNNFEEINFQEMSSNGGENYGWRLMEGNSCYNPSSDCNDGFLKLPIIDYPLESGYCSVTGGYRYRGYQAKSIIDAKYIYADFCKGLVSALTKNGTTWDSQQMLSTDFLISCFGQDELGELYLSDYASDGNIYRLVDDSAAAKIQSIKFRKSKNKINIYGVFFQEGLQVYRGQEAQALQTIKYINSSKIQIQNSDQIFSNNNEFILIRLVNTNFQETTIEINYNLSQWRDPS